MRFALFTFSLFAATAAIAQDAPSRPMMSDACRAEVMKTCPPSGDRGAMRQCIVANRDKFSDECKKEMADMRAAREKMRGEHSDDMAAPPTDAPPPAQPM